MAATTLKNENLAIHSTHTSVQFKRIGDPLSALENADFY